MTGTLRRLAHGSHEPRRLAHHVGKHLLRVIPLAHNVDSVALSAPTSATHSIVPLLLDIRGLNVNDSERVQGCRGTTRRAQPGRVLQKVAHRGGGAAFDTR